MVGIGAAHVWALAVGAAGLELAGGATLRFSLGLDPARGFARGWLPEEMQTAMRIESRTGVQLMRSSNPGVDWIDRAGQTYDAIGSRLQAQFFDSQWANVQERIVSHLGKADYVAVDVSQLTAEQAALVQEFISKLGPRVFVVGG